MMSSDRSAPLLISFYAGSNYYRSSAAVLSADCARVGLDNHIVELELNPGEDWIAVCRRKIPYIFDMYTRFGRPLLWLDVDSRIAAFPDFLMGTACDMAGFLRGFEYVREFDPIAAPRFFSPTVMFFNQTRATAEFVALMARLERDSDLVATDDYFLQEAWRQHRDQLAVLMLPPDLVGKTWPLTGRQVFLAGVSGNVSKHRARATQHVSQLAAPRRRRLVLAQEAGLLLKEGDESAALVLYRRALNVVRADDGLAQKIARIMRRQGQLADAMAFLGQYQDGNSDLDLANRFAVESALLSQRLDAAREGLLRLRQSGGETDIDWADAMVLRVDLEAFALRQRADRAMRMEMFVNARVPDVAELVLPYVTTALTGQAPRLTTVVGPGVLSSISSARPGSLVWGGGVSGDGESVEVGAMYAAVRGPLTRKVIVEEGGRCPEIYGDPARLLPRVYQPRRASHRHALGLIVDHGSSISIRQPGLVMLVSSRRAGFKGLEEFIDEICACDRVLCTSLTGLMIAEAYGVPARWCQGPPEQPLGSEKEFAFRDYLLSTASEVYAPQPWPDEGSSDERVWSATTGPSPSRRRNDFQFACAAPFAIAPAILDAIRSAAAGD